ncbi:hypothetical protein [Actinokineospora enzanensis]|uniref:hypothetical protein n=1 Tax=Actinokineospora enzanensis TaxID=155975 RepID=UPI0003696A99|nr:hypothetical protein [Actinokineospora enzanensis]
MAKRALVLGGTGMLAGCTARLVAGGWHVVLPSRRYAPLATDRGLGRALWVEADWSAPRALARRAGHVLEGPADLVIAWLDDSARLSVLRAVEPLLAPGAPVIEVYGVTDHAPRPATTLPAHPTQHVVLGVVGYAGRTRWLSSAEVTAAIVDAVDRALTHRTPSVHYIGDGDSPAIPSQRERSGVGPLSVSGRP